MKRMRSRITILAVLVAASLCATLPAGATIEVDGPGGSAYEAALAAKKAGNNTVALDKLEEALRAEPNNLRYGSEYRQLVIQLKEYDRAIAFFEALVEAHPKAANAYLNLGFASVDKMPDEGAVTQVLLANEALTQFGKALELEESWLALYTRGNSYLFWPPIFGRAPLAMDDLNKAVAIAKKNGNNKSYYVRGYVALGDGFWRNGDVEKAKETWARALKIFPDDADLKARVSRDGEALDEFMENYFDPNKRVDTDLSLLWADN